MAQEPKQHNNNEEQKNKSTVANLKGDAGLEAVRNDLQVVAKVIVGGLAGMGYSVAHHEMTVGKKGEAFHCVIRFLLER